MRCRHAHCGQPVMRCGGGPFIHPCNRWVHVATGMHECTRLGDTVADPEPGMLPLVEAPTRPPQGEVA